MFGLAFSNSATSSVHSLCWTGCCDAGGAQSMLIVTGAAAAAEVALGLAAAVLLVLGLAVLLELLLVQAAAVRTMPATLATATIGR